MLVCSFLHIDKTALPLYERVGCFKDKRNPRAFPDLVVKYPDMVNDSDLANSLATIVHACANEVYKNGFWYFGVEYRYECWSGMNGNKTYNTHGSSDDCLSNYGVGDKWTIFVYRFVEGKLLVDHFTGI